MRIWSMHPKYLDTKGLVALWRETLLAKNVLEGNTKGYKNHSQLNRFKEHEKPIDAINYYLKIVWQEAKKRNYNFDKSKFINVENLELIKLTDGQLNYEKEHLSSKLKLRNVSKFAELSSKEIIEYHPLFELVEGEVESWEIIS